MDAENSIQQQSAIPTSNRQTDRLETNRKDTQTKEDNTLLKRADSYVFKPKESVSFIELQFYLADWKVKCMALVGLLGCLLFSVTNPALSFLLGTVTDDLAEDPSTSEFSDRVNTLAIYLILSGTVVGLGATLLSVGWGYAGRVTANKIKIDYFKHIMRQEQLFFDNVNTFEFSTKVNSQCGLIQKGLGAKIGQTIFGGLGMTFSFLTGFLVSWKLSSLLCLIVPVIISITGILYKTVKTSQDKNRQAYEQAGGVAEEVIYNIKTTVAFSNIAHEEERYGKLIELSRDQGLKLGFRIGLFNGLLYFTIFTCYFLAFLYGGYLIAVKDPTVFGEEMTTGSLLVVLFSIVFGSYYSSQTAPFMTAALQALSASKEFFALKERESRLDCSKSTQDVDFAEIDCSIRFNDIYFKYHPAKPDIIQGFTNTFESGKKTAIVGSSGSGKSTLISMIERLYDPYQGNITVGGINLKEIKLECLRGAIGYVPQEPVLFDTSIKENILFGREATDEEIVEACKKANAFDFIKLIDEGLDYRVGTKGSRLSGGQKQRIAIARAILKKPKILLLDEATSALDNISEKKVQKALDEVSRGITTIIIAHRLSTILNAEKIVVMDAGKIVEEGTHESLLEANGRYTDLVKNQIDLNVDVNRKQSLVSNQDEKIEEETFQKAELKDENTKIKQKHKEEDEFYSKNRNKIFEFIKENRIQLVISVFISICSGLIWPTFGLLTADARNDMIEESKPENGKSEHDIIFTGFMVSLDFLALAIIMGIVHFSQNYIFRRFGEIITYKLRKRVYSKFLTMHMGFFDFPENSPGSLLTRLAQDSNNVNGVAMGIIGALFQSLAGLVTGLILSFIFSWKVALVALCIVPLLTIANLAGFYLGGGKPEDEEKAREAGSLLSEAVNSSRSILAYNMQEKVTQIYAEKVAENNGKVVWESLKTSLAYGLSQGMLLWSYGLIFWWGGKLMNEGDIDYLQMNRAAFTMLFAAFSLSFVSMYMGEQRHTKTSFVNLFKILETESEIDPSVEGGKSLQGVKGEIEFRNVSFCYPARPDNFVLRELSFKIEAGQKAAFVGASGSGKSTVIQLIERFYDCTEGQILIDGVDIKEYNLIELRKAIGIVFQEPAIFKQSIRENIRYGDLKATDETINEVAEKCLISHKLNAESKEEIANVSGGEKQRVAIARAVIKNPTIMLLDEATSALDQKSEEQVQETIEKVIEGKTSISVAHRLTTIANSDVIFYMEKGKIEESGTQEKLLEMKGKYYKLHSSMGKASS